jgi:adenylate cyclase
VSVSPPSRSTRLPARHLWADRFDGSQEDVFELQDEGAWAVAGVIEPALEAAEIRRSANRRTNDLTAYDMSLHAISDRLPRERQGIVEGVHLLRWPIERDPPYGPALALAAVCRQNLDVNGWGDEPEENRKTGVHLARQAPRVAGDDPGILASAAYVLAYFGEDIDAAIELIDRALTLNPALLLGRSRAAGLGCGLGNPIPQ